MHVCRLAVWRGVMLRLRGLSGPACHAAAVRGVSKYAIFSKQNPSIYSWLVAIHSRSTMEEVASNGPIATRSMLMYAQLRRNESGSVSIIYERCLSLVSNDLRNVFRERAFPSLVLLLHALKIT